MTLTTSSETDMCSSNNSRGRCNVCTEIECPKCEGAGSISDGDEIGLCESCMGDGTVPKRFVDTGTLQSDQTTDDEINTDR